METHDSVPHRFEFHFDLPFLRKAIGRDFLWRCWVLLASGATILVVYGFAFDRWSWSLGLAVTGALTIGEIALLLRWHQTAKSAYDLWSEMAPDHKGVYELDAEGFTVMLGDSCTRYEWKALRRLWRYPDAWMLEMVRKVSVLFRPQDAGPEALAYIEERCKEAGVRM